MRLLLDAGGGFELSGLHGRCGDRVTFKGDYRSAGDRVLLLIDGDRSFELEPKEGALVSERFGSFTLLGEEGAER
jgi:hypothetical protein